MPLPLWFHNTWSLPWQLLRRSLDDATQMYILEVSVSMLGRQWISSQAVHDIIISRSVYGRLCVYLDFSFRTWWFHCHDYICYIGHQGDILFLYIYGCEIHISLNLYSCDCILWMDILDGAVFKSPWWGDKIVATLNVCHHHRDIPIIKRLKDVWKLSETTI